MTNLSWSEVRDRSIAFSRKWSDERRESEGKQTFWNEFFAVFGRERRTVASFEVAVRNLQGKFNYIDLLWRGVLLVEHKSAGKPLAAAESQAFAYIQDLAREGRHDEAPRYVILSDFAKFALYDLEPDEQADLPLFAGIHYSLTEFNLADLHKFIRHFAFIKGERTLRIKPEDPANHVAYDRMCGLHDELLRGGFSGTDLEQLLVRILFCIFAEDTEVFEPNAFTSFIRDNTRDDGSDLGARLNELFHVLNTARERRSGSLPEGLAALPYVNGRLFADPLGFASFNRGMRARLLEAADFQWARVSPAVFGSLFQGIMGDVERRQQGAHYTSERDIMKVVRSLFLDDLREEFDAIKADRSNRRTSRLESFHDKLRSLQFLDPACGCGNFLVLAYRELRLLELDLLRELHRGQQVFDVRDLIRVDVDQFYGIELSEWPARIAEVAMWLMDHQMNQRVSEAFGHTFERLPLRTSAHIVQGNALRMDWREVLPPGDGVFVLGNPPFVGKQFRSNEQQSDMVAVWGGGASCTGVLDYVTCWYRKAAEYIAGSRVTVAFVSTNSITQGEQVGILWKELFGRWRLKIHFAHRTFPWQSEARGKAHVHVAIIGFGESNPMRKQLYEYDTNDGHGTSTLVLNISPYLLEGNDTVVEKRTRPIGDAPEIAFGNMPNDGGHLLLSAQEAADLRRNSPSLSMMLRRFLGSVEFINGFDRYCLWLVGVEPAQIRATPEVLRRVEAVRYVRSKSPRPTTRALADLPALFGEIRQPTKRYLAIPKTSSINRRYIPMGYLEPEVIASTELQMVEGATSWHLGILTSVMHMAWTAVVCGRLKSDYRYSNQLVYNNFPWPTNLNPKHQSAVTAAAEAVLAARAPFLPPHGTSTLADLYDPLTMPAPLAKAHATLDRAVDRCYRPEPFKSDRERVEHLFALYETLTAPLLPTSPTAAKRSRKKMADVDGGA